MSPKGNGKKPVEKIKPPEELTPERYFLERSGQYLQKDFLPKIEKAVKDLSHEEIWRRPNGNSNSIGNLLLHLEGNVRQRVVAALGGKPDVRRRHAEFHEQEQPAKEIMLKRLAAAVEEARKTLLKVDPKTLLDWKEIQGAPIRVMDNIIHVVEHFAYHTGQIIYKVKAERDTSFPWYDHLKGT